MNDNKQIITIESYGLKYSVEMSNDATWMQALDSFVRLLNAAGYYLSEEKLINWANETEAVR